MNSGRFVASTQLEPALESADIAIIAVGTPSDDNGADLSSVRAVARTIGSHLKDNDRYLPVVVKSTVPPGTTDTIVRLEIAQRSGRDIPSFGLGMNPEFLREGDAVADFMEPDRIVLGHEDERTLARLEELYESWPAEKLRMNTRSAELLKYANNALLATQVSAINEIANLAAALGGIDIMEVVAGVHMDGRWNPPGANRTAPPGILRYLVPGCGFGGSCLPKDLRALRAAGRRVGVPMHVVDAVLRVNESQPYQVFDLLQQHSGDLANRTVMVLGLAFKPGTDDVRESASVKLVECLLDKGVRIIAHDPRAAANFQTALGQRSNNVRLVDDWRGHVDRADVIVVATSWPEYRDLAVMDLTGKVLFDGRCMFRPDEVTSGKYLSIGRGAGEFTGALPTAPTQHSENP
jgi:UDPglucose 6-dehydrogenase/GDP-mannose 6-dehydrogenase